MKRVAVVVCVSSVIVVALVIGLFFKYERTSEKAGVPSLQETEEEKMVASVPLAAVVPQKGDDKSWTQEEETLDEFKIRIDKKLKTRALLEKQRPPQPRDRTVFETDSQFLRTMAGRFDRMCAYYGDAEWARPFAYGLYDGGEWFLASNIDGDLELWLSQSLSPREAYQAQSCGWKAYNEEDPFYYGYIAKFYVWPMLGMSVKDTIQEALNALNSKIPSLKLRVVEYLK